MMFTFTVLIGCILFSTSNAAPAATCEDQLECLDINIREVGGSGDDTEYEVCLVFNPELSGCRKEDEISYACSSPEKGAKIEGWGPGEENEMCSTVNCDGFAYFGIKDGRGCFGSTPEGGYSFSGVDDVYCFALDNPKSGYCHGGNKNACTWKVPAPECPSETTTTEAPETTEEAAPTTTEEAPTTTEEATPTTTEARPTTTEERPPTTTEEASPTTTEEATPTTTEARPTTTEEREATTTEETPPTTTEERPPTTTEARPTTTVESGGDCAQYQYDWEACELDANCCNYQIPDNPAVCMEKCMCIGCLGTEMMDCIDEECCEWNYIEGGNIEDGQCQSVDEAKMQIRNPIMNDLIVEDEGEVSTVNVGSIVGWSIFGVFMFVLLLGIGYYCCVYSKRKGVYSGLLES